MLRNPVRKFILAQKKKPKECKPLPLLQLNLIATTNLALGA